MKINIVKNLSGTDILETIVAMLKEWDWDAVAEDVTYTDDGGTSRLGTVFYPDNKHKVALAVQKLGTSVANGIDFCTVNNNVVTGVAHLSVIQTDSTVRCMQNNTAMCISQYTENTEPDVPDTMPHSFFVALAVSQESGTVGESVIGKYDYVADDYTSYTLYSSEDVAAVTADYDIYANAPYTTLLPLIGSNAGVLSGIYYPLMLESDTKEIKIMHVNGKTFYRCGNAVMIDYFVG